MDYKALMLKYMAYVKETTGDYHIPPIEGEDSLVSIPEYMECKLLKEQLEAPNKEELTSQQVREVLKKYIRCEYRGDLDIPVWLFDYYGFGVVKAIVRNTYTHPSTSKVKYVLVDEQEDVRAECDSPVDCFFYKKEVKDYIQRSYLINPDTKEIEERF